MEIGDHLKTTGSALKNWAVAQFWDSLAVGLLWLIGLLLLKVPLAPLWAIIGAFTQMIPYLGPILGLMGPGLITAAEWAFDGKPPERMLYVLILYAVIAVVDGLVLQPYFMRRSAKVPIWASILAPIVLGMIIPFWGVLLSPPLLAVVWAYRAKAKPSRAAL